MSGNVSVPENQAQIPWHALCVSACVLSHIQLFATPWTLAHQPPLSMGFPKQEYWSGLPFLTPGGLPNSGIKAASPALAGRFLTTIFSNVFTSYFPAHHISLIASNKLFLASKFAHIFSREFWKVFKTCYYLKWS